MAHEAKSLTGRGEMMNLLSDMYLRSMVISSSKKGGVDVYFIKTMNSQYEGFANAKLVVATGDYTVVTNKDFWPENVFVREWYQGKEKDKKQVNAGHPV